jgi:hypothetical protein
VNIGWQHQIDDFVQPGYRFCTHNLVYGGALGGRNKLPTRFFAYSVSFFSLYWGLNSGSQAD